MDNQKVKGVLTHLDEEGNPRMVDVHQKLPTTREALAEGWIILDDSTISAISEHRINKGDVIQIAQLAGIMGSKQTASLIPLCHPIPIDGVEVSIRLVPGKGAHIQALVKTTWKTGVEMEALTAVSIAALTMYDMIKSIHKGAQIEGIKLLRKIGGKSGEWNKN